MDKNIKIFLLIGIFIIAFFVRVVGLDKNPSGFFCDEASIGFNAYSVFKTGNDQYGVKLPLFFKSFGEYKNPIFIYSTVPFVGFLGLSEVSVRIVSVFYGLIAVYGIFLLGRCLFNENVGIISSFLLAISPWHIHFSRVGFELISSVTFVIFAVFFFKKNYLLSVVFFILAFFSYNTPKFYLLPLFLILFLQNYHQLINIKKFWTINIFAVVFVMFLIIPSLKDGSFFARWNQLYDQNTKSNEIIKAYFNYFSIDFLFKKGDIDFQGQNVTRHSIRGIGELYWFQLPLIIIFLISLFDNSHRKSKIFIFLFLIIYPLGSMFTSVNPQAPRSIIGVVPLTIASAYGFWIVSKIKVLKYLLILLFLYGFYNFINLYRNYPNYSSDFWGWQYGPKKIMSYFVSNAKNYDQLCMEGNSNGPEIFLKFFDPKNICQGKCALCTPEINDPEKRQLFAVNYSYPFDREKFKIKDIIYYPNSTIAFFIISNHD